MRLALFMTLFSCAVSFTAAQDVSAKENLIWSELPPLPPAPGQETQIGLAGPFAGSHGDALLIAGGANFPEALPWEGGQKVWWDDVFALQKDADGAAQWLVNERYKLPRPLAYGVSVSVEEGVICIGGCDAGQCYRDVFLLKWNSETRTLETESLPPLPRPLAFMAGALVGQTIYVAGGQETMTDAKATKNFWSLDLSRKVAEADFAWKELPAWPGPARVVPVAVGQSDGTDDCFYLFSGRNIAPGATPEILTDAYSYNPKSGEWKQLADIAPGGGPPRCVMAAPGIAVGVNHILIFGGADGRLFVQLDQLERDIQAAGDSPEAPQLSQRKLDILNNHPGFSRDVLAYHTVTDSWAMTGQMPTGSHVTTTAVEWDDASIVPTGEIRPGVRTPKVWRADSPPPPPFGGLNYSVLGIYMAALVAMGVYFSRRGKSTDDFFKAGRRIPWWAAGLSIFGTQLSAITFMAIPAKTFATDWTYFMLNMTIVMVAPFIIIIYLPFYRRLNITTAYEYLEMRFNLTARLIGSMMYIVFQLGRIGIVLFLPSVALSVVTGIDVYTCILGMGVLSIIYTVLGGIEAVIWTDVLQVIVLVGGALLSLIIIPFHVEGGVGGVIDLANSAAKLRTFDLSFDFTSPTLWVMVFGGIAYNLTVYGSDQTVIQRYLTTKDEKSAARAIWTSALMAIPATLLFFSIGTALYAYYKTHPQLMSPTLSDPSAIFPWYIVSQLPAGVAGLLIAAIFAASMSSLDSSMNSVAATVTTDFYRRFRPEAADHKCLALARWVTVIIGAAGILFAIMMAGWGIKSMWDQMSMFLGLFAGGLGGLFLLGIFSRRAHGVGGVIGLVASGAVQYGIKEFTPVHVLMYAFTGVVSCIIVGYAASLLIPAEGKSIEGLTIHTRAKRAEE